MNRLQSKKRGSAIPLALLVVVILLAIGTGLLSLGLNSRIYSMRTTSEIAARCAADAGLTKAVFAMNERLKVTPWDDSTLPQATNESLANCNAAFSYTITGDMTMGYTVESIGKSDRAEKKVKCTVLLQGPFEDALFAQEAMTLKAGTLVTGYNSLDPSDTDIKVLIGTNSILPDSIVLNAGVIVNGSILVGVGGDVEYVIKDLGATMDHKFAVFEEVEFPPITTPVLPDKGTDIYAHGTTLQFSDADSGKYTGVRLKNATTPGILEITSGDVVLHVTGDIDLGQSCEIKIKQGASLVLYLDGNLDAGNDAGINNEDSPAKFKLYGASEGEQLFNLRAKSNCFGAVYAPNAIVTLNADGDVYGAFTVKNFEMKSGGNFYYDKALKNVTTDNESVHFVVRQWSED